FDLLWFMASRPGHVFSRDALIQQVWGDDRVVGERSIDSLMSRLRRKLEADPDEPRYLQTVWGSGYRFEGTPPETPLAFTQPVLDVRRRVSRGAGRRNRARAGGGGDRVAPARRP